MKNFSPRRTPNLLKEKLEPNYKHTSHKREGTIHFWEEGALLVRERQVKPQCQQRTSSREKRKKLKRVDEKFIELLK